MKKKRRDYSMIKRDDLPKVEPAERRIICDDIIVDYSIFRKTPEEKLLLKNLKLRHRAYLKREMRRRLR